MIKFTLKSKTHVLGALIGLLGLLEQLAGALPSVREFIPTETYGYIFIGFSVATIVIRNLTTKPIGEK